MEKFLLKRRKISETLAFTCDICYNDFPISSIVLCFHNCTIKTCNECITKQLRIEKTRRIHNTVNKEMYSIYYTCSMCQQKSYYRKNEVDDKFTNWVQNDPNVLVNLLDKFINPVIPVIEPPADRNDDEDFEQYDLFLSTAFYINEITTPSPSTLPFPYRLLTPPLIRSETIPPASTLRVVPPPTTVNDRQRSVAQSLLARLSPNESTARSTDDADVSESHNSST
jgi:hypothetical protein